MRATAHDLDTHGKIRRKSDLLKENRAFIRNENIIIDYFHGARTVRSLQGVHSPVWSALLSSRKSCVEFTSRSIHPFAGKYHFSVHHKNDADFGLLKFFYFSPLQQICNVPHSNLVPFLCSDSQCYETAAKFLAKHVTLG